LRVLEAPDTTTTDATDDISNDAYVHDGDEAIEDRFFRRFFFRDLPISLRRPVRNNTTRRHVRGRPRLTITDAGQARGATVLSLRRHPWMPCARFHGAPVRPPSTPEGRRAKYVVSNVRLVPARKIGCFGRTFEGAVTDFIADRLVAVALAAVLAWLRARFGFHAKSSEHKLLRPVRGKLTPRSDSR